MTDTVCNIFPRVVDVEINTDLIPDHIRQHIHIVVRTDGGECWQWQKGHFSEGYASIYYDGKAHYGHKLIYKLTTGVDAPYPAFEHDHLCRHRWCINPACIEIVTKLVNQIRGDTFVAQNVLKTHCPEGHLLEGDNLDPWYLERGRRYCLTCKRATAREAARRYRRAK